MTLGVLMVFFGLRVEQDGSGRALWTFSAPEKLYSQLEAHRAKQKKLEGAQRPAPVEPKMWTMSSPAEPAPRPGPLDWAEFRGAGRDGKYDGAIRTSWPREGLPLLWKQPVGGGHAGFAVAQGRAFTIEQRRNKEVAAAYDLMTGRELWTHAWPAHFQESAGGEGPRATPAWDEGRVYMLGAEGDLRVLDGATGQLLWKRNILKDAGTENLMFGMAASPLIVDDTVVTLPGGRGGKSVMAYDKRTGQPAWSALDDMQSYTAPMVATLAGKRQLIIVSAERIAGLDAGPQQTGRVLWEHPWTADNNVNSPQPIVVDGEHVFLSGGSDRGSKLLRIRAANGGYAAGVVWESNTMKNSFNSSVLLGGHIYGFDGSIFACISARTGDKKWKGGRYGFGQVLLAGEHLVVVTERGEVALVRATPEKFEELALFPAIEGRTWNYPSLANGVLLVRNAREMAAYRISD